MKSAPMLLGVIILAALALSAAQAIASDQQVEFNFDMIERGIEWLDLISSGASEESIEAFYRENIVPTPGCQAIILHWSRFRKWDDQELFNFIMTALDKIPSTESENNEDGSLSFFGMRRKLWRQAINGLEQMRRDLAALKQADLQKSISIAESFLPEQTLLDARFSFVLFGHSTAFSVGRENGFDFLQLPRDSLGQLDLDQIIKTIAHELHHAGFMTAHSPAMRGVKNRERLQLLGILAAEGMPTYYIDQMNRVLDEYQGSDDTVKNKVAEDWIRHSARIDELFHKAEEDLRANLVGELEPADLMSRWMAGYKGPAYVLGAKMIETIDRHLGRGTAISIASDYRKLVKLYNQAVRSAERRGEKGLYRFSEELADLLNDFQGLIVPDHEPEGG